MNKWGEAYIEHFDSFLGKLSDREVFENEQLPRSMQVLRYDEAGDGAAFCSFGLSHYGGRVGGIAEVYCPVDSQFEWVPQVFAVALFYIVSEGVELDHGTNIGGLHAASPEFFRGCGKTAVLFTQPTELSEGFGAVGCDGEAGRVLRANFISQAEATFLRGNGSDALLGALANEDVDLTNLKRPSIV